MHLVSRSVLREIWPPSLLGFAAYTFILLVRTIYFLADFFVRRSATFGEVAWLAVLSLPWIVVLTLPMAFLLGVLIGVGRLAGDSEIVALRSCGVGPAAVYRPALLAAAVLSVGVFLLYNLVLPSANEALSRSLARVAATSVVNVVQPRTFREVRSGVTLFFDRAAPDGRSLEGVFVQLGEEYEKDLRVIVARRGALTLEGDRLWLDLFNSTLHEYDANDPSRYRINHSQTQRVLIAGDIWSSSAANPPRTTGWPGSRSTRSSRFPSPAWPSRSSGSLWRRAPGAAGKAAHSPFPSRSSSCTTSCSLPARPGPSRAGSLRESRSGFPTLFCSPAGQSRLPAREGKGRAGAGRSSAPRGKRREPSPPRDPVPVSAASCVSRVFSTATCWPG